MAREWHVDFNMPKLLPQEQPNITTQVTTAHRNVPALQAARYAVVYKYVLPAPCLRTAPAHPRIASAGGIMWWHMSSGDRRPHVTVRFLGAERPTRTHVYEDGTASIRPDRPARAAAATDEEDDDGALTPFSDEEVEAGGGHAESAV